MLDFGGKEMDLREKVDFVPIGVKEKADDMPARFQKRICNDC